MGQGLASSPRWVAFLAYEPALKDLLDFKGHAVTRCCFMCLNCVLHKAPADSLPLHLFSSYCSTILETDIKKFKAHSDTTLKVAMQRLHAYKGVLKNEDFKRREQLMGLSWNPASIILNEKFCLRAITISMWDWGHCYVSDGLADTEFGLCMHALRFTASTYRECAQYVLSYTVPKARGMPTHLFEPKRFPNYIASKSFAAISSEFLTLAPILRRYFSHVVARRGQHVAHVRSMVAVLDVIELLQACKHKDMVSPEVLYNAIQRHLNLSQDVYGPNFVRPKHHYVLHLPQILAHFKVLIATFTHERRHRVAKRYTRNRTNLKAWGVGAIEDITCHQIWELQQPFFQVDTSSKPKGLILHALRELFPLVADADMTLHSNITINGGKCSSMDVVSYALDGNACVGRLYLTVGFERRSSAAERGPLAAERALVSVVSVWEQASVSDCMRYRSFTVRARKVKVPTCDLDTVFTHRMSKDGKQSTILVPKECRL